MMISVEKTLYLVTFAKELLVRSLKAWHSNCLKPSSVHLLGLVLMVAGNHPWP
jgi:hypothetical protein